MSDWQINVLGDALAFNQTTWDWFVEKAKAAGYSSVTLRVYELIATSGPPIGEPPPVITPPPTQPPPIVNWWEKLSEGQYLRVVNPNGATQYYDAPVDKPDPGRHWETKPFGNTSLQVKRGDDGKCNHGPYILVKKFPPHNLWVNAADVKLEP